MGPVHDGNMALGVGLVEEDPHFRKALLFY